ncbi:MAG: hypothetical protein AAGI88_06245, partial [Pseudomonadota bacterium]
MKSRFQTLVLAALVAVSTSSISENSFSQSTPDPVFTWAFEETFDGDPSAPSQDLLPRSFEYVATHRSHPKEMFSKPYAAYPADHGIDCAGPNPDVSPLPQHEVFTT